MWRFYNFTTAVQFLNFAFRPRERKAEAFQVYPACTLSKWHSLYAFRAFCASVTIKLPPCTIQCEPYRAAAGWGVEKAQQGGEVNLVGHTTYTFIHVYLPKWL
jgi:hypothetical protein